MAKYKEDCGKICTAILDKIDKGEFSPIYLLSGEEPYYSDLIIKELEDKVLTPAQKDFNFMLLYGQDSSGADVVSLCRRYPVFSPRQLIIVKEAQNLSPLTPFEHYFAAPLKETVLVLAFTNKNIDKRTLFYKKFPKSCTFFESTKIEEYRMADWTEEYVHRAGYKIESAACTLFAESVGNELRKASLELEKLFKAIDNKTITVKDVEANIGVSREFNAFELCKALSEKNRLKAFSIAKVFGENPKKYPIQLTMAALFWYFNIILKIEAAMACDKVTFDSAAAQFRIFGSRAAEYMMATRNYPIAKCMGVISLLKECDLKSKSSSKGNLSDGDLLNMLIAKILA